MTARLYQTVGRLGAKLSLLAVGSPELFEGVPQMVTQ
jgi:hypothetical protein